MLSRAAAGHLVTPIVKVESPTELTASRTLLLLLMVDVEWFHRHRPSGQEVESGVLSSYQVTVVAFNIVAPFDLATPFLHYLNGITVGYSRKRNTWDFYGNRI